MGTLGHLVRRAVRYVPPALVRGFAGPTAFLFHGVEPSTQDGRVQTNHHEVEIFHRIARNLKQNFEVLPLAALDEVLKRPERRSRVAFLMSDDGYANTLGVAADILEDLKLPWSLFLSTHHIDTGEHNPIFLARLFAYFCPEGTYWVPHFEKPIALGTADRRDAWAAIIIERLRTLDATRAGQALKAMTDALAATGQSDLPQRFGSETFLSWDQARALHARGVEIGAHAHAHWPMHERQSCDHLREQAQTSRTRIEAEIGPCRYFAYPFGNVGDISTGAWRAVRDAGFDYAFTTLSGTLDASINPYLMPRYSLGPNDTRLGALAGILRAANPRLVRWQRALGSVAAQSQSGKAARPKLRASRSHL